MVAFLAVPVPGFPIAREAIVAAGAEIVDLYSARAGVDEAGEMTALVAAGRVFRLPPEDRLDRLERLFDQLQPVIDDFSARQKAEARDRLASL